MTDKSFESFERWWDGKENDNEWKRAFDRMIADALENKEELDDEKD